jgi:hypothetical protein
MRVTLPASRVVVVGYAVRRVAQDPIAFTGAAWSCSPPRQSRCWCRRAPRRRWIRHLCWDGRKSSLLPQSFRRLHRESCSCSCSSSASRLRGVTLCSASRFSTESAVRDSSAASAPRRLATSRSIRLARRFELTCTCRQSPSMSRVPSVVLSPLLVHAVAVLAPW